MDGADTAQAVLAIDEPGKRYAAAPGQRARAVPAVDVLQRQQAAQAVAHLHSGVGAHAEEDTQGASQRGLVSRGRFRAEVVLEHVVDGGGVEQLAVVGQQRAQHLDVVGAGHEQAVAAKVSAGALVHVAVAAEHGAAEGVGVVRVEVDEAGAQVLARDRVELGVGHAERVTDALLHVLAQRATRHPLHHAAGPVESGAVHPAGAGLEAERVAERLLDRPALAFLRRVELLAPPGDVRVDEVVGEAGAVREQHLERDGAGWRLEQGGFAVVGKASEDLLGGELGRDGGQVASQGQQAVLDALQGGDGGDQLGGRGQVQHVVEPLRPLLARQQGALAERLVVDEATLGVSGTNDGAVDLAGIDGRMEASLDVVCHGGGKRPIRFQLKKERDTERVSAEICLEDYLLLSVRDYPHGALFIRDASGQGTCTGNFGY